MAKEGREEKVRLLAEKIHTMDAVVIGAGSGLSEDAGLEYGGFRLQKYFGDFKIKYDIDDMYAGCFYPFETEEEYWAYWSRFIYVNRYMNVDNGLYNKLYELVKDKDYFVLTTNADHQFQKAHFEKDRLFYVRGDYGLWQCSKPCRNVTYDNKDDVTKMFLKQKRMKVPPELIPRCPACSRPLMVNLCIDNTFVKDEGWHRAQERYLEFQRIHENDSVLYLELGVETNTLAMIKYMFRSLVSQNRSSFYASINRDEEYAPPEIMDRSLMVNGSCGEIIGNILAVMECLSY